VVSKKIEVAAVCDRTDRRHLHRQVDGRGPCGLRAIRQRRAFRSHARGYEAALELGRRVFLAPIGYLNAPRSMGKSLVHDPERAGHSARFRGVRNRPIQDRATAETPHESPRKATHVAGDRRAAAQPVVRRHRGRARVRCRRKRGDFDPLVSEELFFQVQAVLSGRIPSTAPRQRAHPDFPLRGFVRWRARSDRQLVEGPKRVLHVLPLPPRLPRNQAIQHILPRAAAHCVQASRETDGSRTRDR
jgi:hypothetical protein